MVYSFYKNPGCYLVGLHDGVGLEVGRLLHEASNQQHGFAFGLQAARVHQWLVIGETLGHALLQDDQGLVYIALITNTKGFIGDVLCVRLSSQNNLEF